MTLSFSRFLCTILLIAGWSISMADTVSTRLFYDDARVSNMKIAPDGEHVAFTFPDESEVKLAIMNLDSQQLTTVFGLGKNQHVFNFWWSSNSRVVMSVGEVTGYLDNMGRPSRLYAGNIDGSRREQLHDGQGGFAQLIHPLPDDPDHILVARYHWADGGTPRAHRIHTYRRTYSFVGDQPASSDIIALIPDNSGDLRVALESKSGQTFDEAEFNLHVKHPDGWRMVSLDQKRQPVSVRPAGFSADNSRAYFLSNHDVAEGDTMGLFRYDFASQRVELLHRDEEVDISGIITGHDGEVLGALTRSGPATYTFLEEAADNDDAVLLQRLALSFPGQDISITSFTSDGNRALVFVRGDRNPGEFFLFDLETMQARFLSAAMPDLPTDVLVPMEPIRVTARDGLELHGFLTRPTDQQENLPLLIEVHGGPFGIADQWGFNRNAQFFAQHGFATLQINFRGSGNRGTDFVNKGRRQWGQAMQDDVTDATRWAIEQGIADPDRICIHGGSYGGYATLMGLVREPELYQCGVAFVAVADLPWFRSGDGNDWSRQRGRRSRTQREQWFTAHVGDDETMLRRNSPVHNAERIKADLFLIHGAADVRVVVGHAERMRDALNAIGKAHEWMVKEEEGHGFYSVDNRVEMAEAMLDFFNRSLGTNRNGR